MEKIRKKTKKSGELYLSPLCLLYQKLVGTYMSDRHDIMLRNYQ